MTSDNPSPRVLIAIVNYNCGDWLQRCLDSVTAQQPPGDNSLQICIVDNASSDESLDYLKTIDGTRDDLHVLFNDTNTGFAAACNLAAASMAFDYLLILNPDCELPAHAIASVIRIMAEKSQTGIAGVRVNDHSGQEQRASRRLLPTPGRSLITALGLEKLGFSGINSAPVIEQQHENVEAISGAFMMIRQACWDQLGGMDDAYFLHCEDLDLFVRARSAGWDILYCPQVQIEHAKGVSQRQCRLDSERHKRDSMLRYYRQHMRAMANPLLRWLWPLLLRLRYRLYACLWWRH